MLNCGLKFLAAAFPLLLLLLSCSREGGEGISANLALRSPGRSDEAADAYRRSVAAAPRYAEPVNGLGTLEVERDRPLDALSYFDRALAFAPSYHKVRPNRGIALEMAGDRDAAAAAYQEFHEATRKDSQFEEQRRAAEHLLARLASGPAVSGRR